MKLVWDKLEERLYENGVRNGVLYPTKSNGTYDNGVAWNGLTAVTESPSGAEPTKLWADNINYHADTLTDFLETVRERCRFSKWFCGHYHLDRVIDERFVIQWERISKID